jgi:hypothetical protein
MGLDIRLPIGLLFTAIGAILTVYGAVSDTAMYERSLGFNVNLVWGALLLVFGLIMLFLGRRGTSGMHPSSTSPEGRAIEEMEKRTGKESD